MPNYKAVDDGEDREKECNAALIKEVAEDMGLTQGYVNEVIHHYSEFIATTMRTGSLEGVQVPFLGKFQVKLKYQQYRAHLHTLNPIYKKLFQNSEHKLLDEFFKTDNE